MGNEKEREVVLDSLTNYQKITIDVFLVEDTGVILAFDDGEIDSFSNADDVGDQFKHILRRKRKEWRGAK